MRKVQAWQAVSVPVSVCVSVPVSVCVCVCGRVWHQAVIRVVHIHCRQLDKFKPGEVCNFVWGVAQLSPQADVELLQQVLQASPTWSEVSTPHTHLHLHPPKQPHTHSHLHPPQQPHTPSHLRLHCPNRSHSCFLHLHLHQHCPN